MGLLDLFKIKHPKNQGYNAIKLVYDNTSVTGKQRHATNQFIISKYSESDEPLEILAVAVSLDREGAKYRKQAIEYYERFLENPVEIPIVPGLTNGNGKPVRCISYWQLYSSLGTLYEKEHNYEAAAKCYRLLPKESNYSNIADFTRCGNALYMVDIQLCIEYYLNLMKDPKLIKYKKEFEKKYREYLKEFKAEEKEGANEHIVQELQWITDNLPDIAPKSLSGYKRMKNSNSKNFQNIVNKAKEKGFEIK